MGLQPTTESEEACRLAPRLAELTRTSLAAIVTELPRDRVAAEKDRYKAGGGDQLREAWLAEAMRVSEEAADEFTRSDAGPLTSDHGDLYDEDGLPS